MRVDGPGELELQWLDDTGARVAEKIAIEPA
jgi:hypothetical protein